jgi:hypothetical protein
VQAIRGATEQPHRATTGWLAIGGDFRVLGLLCLRIVTKSQKMHIEQQDGGWVIRDGGSQRNQPIDLARHPPGIVWTGSSWSIEPHRAIVYQSYDDAVVWSEILTAQSWNRR